MKRPESVSLTMELFAHGQDIFVFQVGISEVIRLLEEGKYIGVVTVQIRDKDLKHRIVMGPC